MFVLGVTTSYCSLHFIISADQSNTVFCWFDCISSIVGFARFRSVCVWWSSWQDWCFLEPST